MSCCLEQNFPASFINIVYRVRENEGVGEGAEGGYLCKTADYLPSTLPR